MHNSHKIESNRFNLSPFRRKDEDEDRPYPKFFREDEDPYFLNFLYATHIKSRQLKHEPGLEIQIEDSLYKISVALTFLTMDELLKIRKQLSNNSNPAIR
jgi:hypothetical protein